MVENGNKTGAKSPRARSDKAGGQYAPGVKNSPVRAFRRRCGVSVPENNKTRPRGKNEACMRQIPRKHKKSPRAVRGLLLYTMDFNFFAKV